MQAVIYIDMFLLINFLINYFLLLSAKRLSSAAGSRVRIAFASGVGALFALVILLPPMHLAVQLLYKVATGLVLVLLAFKLISVKMFLKAAFWFTACSFLLAGAILVCIVGFSFQGVNVNNLAFNFSISPFLLFSCMLVVYSCVYLITVFFGPPAALQMAQTKVQIGGVTLQLNAMYDTGFRLEDPLSGRPVVLASYQACKTSLPPLTIQTLEGYYSGKYERLPGGLRLLPFRTASGQGIVPAISADMVVVTVGGSEQVVSAPLLAFTREPLEAGVEALVGPNFAQKVKV